MSVHLRPETEARIEALAAASGVSVEDYIAALVERASPSSSEVAPGKSQQEQGSGMVEENGLRVYRTGKPLPAQFVDDAMRRSREERFLHLLGNTS